MNLRQEFHRHHGSQREMVLPRQNSEDSSVSSQFELCTGPQKFDFFLVTIPQTELVSGESERLLKVITPHFHFDSNKKKGDTHPATELFIVKATSNSCLFQ